MTKKQQLNIYLCRTREFRKWFAALPCEAINLDKMMGYRHTEKYGTPMTPCNSVGCMLGWASHWMNNLKKSTNYNFNAANVYFGLTEIPTTDSFPCDLFAVRQVDRLSHHAEALRRLDRRIAGLVKVQRKVQKEAQRC